MALGSVQTFDAGTLVAERVEEYSETFDPIIGAQATRVDQRNRWLKGLLVIGNNDGMAPSPRMPLHVNLDVDGSMLPDPADGHYGYDKVGSPLNVTFRGGFTAEAGYGVNNPGDVLGANDYIVSGTETGDLAGITSFYGRITEAHVKAPDAAVGTVSALVAQSSVDASAGTVTDLHTLFLHGPNTVAGTVTNAVTLRVKAPTLGPSSRWAMRVDGKSRFDGHIAAGTVATDDNAEATPTAANTPTGVYIGRASNASAGICLANGSTMFRVANENSKLVVTRPGAAVLTTIDANGNVVTSGDVEVTGASKGVILRSPNGTRYRVTVGDDGVLSTAAA